MRSGVDLIRDERLRQITEEGWTSDHDDEHIKQELAQAAAAYAMPPVYHYEGLDSRITFFPRMWDQRWWKPSPENRVRELVKAGALIAAEIDRLQRLAEREKE